MAILHISNGGSKAGTSKASNLPGAHLVWDEALVTGPTPLGLSDEEWIGVRADHLAAAYGGEPLYLRNELVSRCAVTGQMLALGAAAWTAYRSPSPQRIEDLLVGDTTPLPFLKPALLCHLARFPSVENGLGQMENTALDLVDRRERTFRALFSGSGMRSRLWLRRRSTTSRRWRGISCTRADLGHVHNVHIRLLGRGAFCCILDTQQRRIAKMPKKRVPTTPLVRRLTSDSEIQEVFDSLGLSSYEQRAKYLSLGLTDDATEPLHRRFYTTRLSNNSEPITRTR